jgi:hypothetical protein
METAGGALGGLRQPRGADRRHRAEKRDAEGGRGEPTPDPPAHVDCVRVPGRHAVRGHRLLSRHGTALPRHGTREDEPPRHLPRLRARAALPGAAATNRLLYRHVRIPESQRGAPRLDARLVSSAGDVRLERKAPVLVERVDGGVRGPRSHALSVRVRARSPRVQHRQLLHRTHAARAAGAILFLFEGQGHRLPGAIPPRSKRPERVVGPMPQRLRRVRHDGESRRVGRERRSHARQVQMGRFEGWRVGTRAKSVSADDDQPRARVLLLLRRVSLLQRRRRRPGVDPVGRHHGRARR